MHFQFRAGAAAWYVIYRQPLRRNRVIMAAKGHQAPVRFRLFCFSAFSSSSTPSAAWVSRQFGTGTGAGTEPACEEYSACSAVGEVDALAVLLEGLEANQVRYRYHRAAQRAYASGISWAVPLAGAWWNRAFLSGCWKGEVRFWCLLLHVRLDGMDGNTEPVAWVIGSGDVSARAAPCNLPGWEKAWKVWAGRVCNAFGETTCQNGAGTLPFLSRKVGDHLAHDVPSQEPRCC